MLFRFHLVDKDTRSSLIHERTPCDLVVLATMKELNLFFFVYDVEENYKI